MKINIDKVTKGYIVNVEVHAHCVYESYACETIESALDTIEKLYHEEEARLEKARVKAEAEKQISREIQELKAELSTL